MKKRAASRKKELRTAAIAGIVALVLYFPVLVFGIFRGVNIEETIPVSITAIYAFLLVASIIASVLFLRGFIIIGEKLKNRFLEVMSYIIIISTIIYTCYDFLLLVKPHASMAFSIAALVFFGIAGLLFGIALLPLKRDFGRLATAAGILEIISGISLISVVLVFLMILLYIPLMILEILILFRAADKL